jgi:hypothetical protein
MAFIASVFNYPKRCFHRAETGLTVISLFQRDCIQANTPLLHKRRHIQATGTQQATGAGGTTFLANLFRGLHKATAVPPPGSSEALENPCVF